MARPRITDEARPGFRPRLRSSVRLWLNPVMRCRAAGLLLWVGVVPFLVQAQSTAPEEALDKRRIEAIRLPEILRAMAIKPGDTVADVGAGDGIYTIPLARAAGAAGRVYAVDIDEEGALKPLRRRVERSKLSNIDVIHGTDEDPKLPPGAFDAIMLIDTYH